MGNRLASIFGAQEEDPHSILEDTCIHEIVQGSLWLGNQFAAGYREAMSGITPRNALPNLQKIGITHILCVIDVAPLYADKGIEYLVIPMSDSSSFNLVGCLDRTNKFLATAIDGGGKVFVHCQMGQSRSAAVVIGFLMFQRKWCFKKAFAFVKERRPFISASKFGDQLRQYEKDIGAT